MFPYCFCKIINACPCIFLQCMLLNYLNITVNVWNFQFLATVMLGTTKWKHGPVRLFSISTAQIKNIKKKCILKFVIFNMKVWWRLLACHCCFEQCVFFFFSLDFSFSLLTIIYLLAGRANYFYFIICPEFVIVIFKNMEKKKQLKK